LKSSKTENGLKRKKPKSGNGKNEPKGRNAAPSDARTVAGAGDLVTLTLLMFTSCLAKSNRRANLRRRFAAS
jgi:hypothetical protein